MPVKSGGGEPNATQMNPLVWRGMIVLFAAAAIALLTVAWAWGYLDANFSFWINPANWFRHRF